MKWEKKTKKQGRWVTRWKWTPVQSVTRGNCLSWMDQAYVAHIWKNVAISKFRKYSSCFLSNGHSSNSNIMDIPTISLSTILASDLFNIIKCIKIWITRQSCTPVQNVHNRLVKIKIKSPFSIRLHLYYRHYNVDFNVCSLPKGKKLYFLFSFFKVV